MELRKIIFYPFRIFSGNPRSSIRIALQKGNKRGDIQGGTPKGSSGGLVVQKKITGEDIGWKYAPLLRNLVASILTFYLFILFISFIESTDAFRHRFGNIKVGDYFHITIDQDKTGVFYQDVLSKAVTASEISFFQVFITFILIFLGIKLILLWLGNISTGASQTAKGSRIFMSMSMILLPALGMLSTVIGILSSGDISSEETKVIIFGPSGLGIVGYLLATVFYHLSEYINKE